MAASVGEFKKALSQLKEAVGLQVSQSDSVLKKVLRDAVIQRFEFCVELSWKSALKTLGLPAQPPKPALRDLAQAGLVSDVQLWFGFLEARTKSSHTYAERVAEEVMAVIPQFVVEAEALLEKLEK